MKTCNVKEENKLVRMCNREIKNLIKMSEIMDKQKQGKLTEEDRNEVMKMFNPLKGLLNFR